MKRGMTTNRFINQIKADGLGFKVCIKCKVKKLVSEFWLYGGDRLGRRAKCKNCMKKDSEGWLKKDGNKEKRKEIAKKYRDRNPKKIYKRIRKCIMKNRDHYRAYGKKYDEKRVKEVPDKLKEWNTKATEKYAKENLEKRIVYGIVQEALRSGELIRPNRCSRCNKKCKPQGHHEDYSKPLEVEWLCDLCHKDIHYEKRRLVERELRKSIKKYG